MLSPLPYSHLSSLPHSCLHPSPPVSLPPFNLHPFTLVSLPPFNLNPPHPPGDLTPSLQPTPSHPPVSLPPFNLHSLTLLFHSLSSTYTPSPLSHSLLSTYTPHPPVSLPPFNLHPSPSCLTHSLTCVYLSLVLPSHLRPTTSPMMLPFHSGSSWGRLSNLLSFPSHKYGFPTGSSMGWP